MFAPRYFNYADQPANADAVVLFIGPDLAARKMEANRLLSEGYANYLVIPAFNQIFSTSDKGLLVVNNEFAKTRKSGVFSNYPRFYEDTHKEVLEAKRIMDHYGFKKANFVSSPSHMRRIRLITGYVFHQQNQDHDAYQISFVPERFTLSPQKTSYWNMKFMGNILDESIKMVWFFLYHRIS